MKNEQTDPMLVARLVCTGMSQENIAAVIGISRVHVNRIANRPPAKEYIHQNKRVEDSGKVARFKCDCGKVFRVYEGK